ncbi:peptidylprolyl isomerase [Demequina sp. SYSU T00192]|uniref:Peptidylprolyl isomerase n=1 Tax=Demequina litoralis TaxID=3051660 RepID=A0ABT8G756_9MICO|nr:peptidylprolyl isomerase [Demequina sp. SYSU T00192]MDN4474514.1 peptidylprolyl isomerase [Demequina sp. SYSU T00192]
MSTSKQARAQARKKQQAYEARMAAKRRHRERIIRITALITAGALLLGGGLAVLLIAMHENSQAKASAEAAASSTADEEVTLESGWAVSPEPPDPSYAEDRTWTATLATNQGDIVVELDGAAAPQAVASFVELAKEGFFDGTGCHRLTTAGIYVLQCGDPDGTGLGGPGYSFGPIENAPEDDLYPAGTVAMARVGGDAESMGSQFFIVYQDSTIPSDSAGGYTVLGQVVDGNGSVSRVAEAGTITGDTDGPPAMSVIVNEVSVS